MTSAAVPSFQPQPPPAVAAPAAVAPAAAAAAASPRFFQTITGADGLTKWRIPLATTTNDIDPGTDGVLLGTLGAGTAITLFTMAHAIFFGGKRRKKRSIDADNYESYAAYGSNNELKAPGIDAVYAADTNWCGLRLTCELAAKAGRVLDEDERLMLSFFRGAISADDLHTMPAPQLYYAYASFIGFSSGDTSRCKKMYDKCSYTSRKIMEVYKMASKEQSRRKHKHDL
ncbi:unnamed protein product [Meganyctiphanes norvegica]|uniref:Uncharacterized protein n=1 Tax=Meganyctiphanes norvegica TaxID=48144 RepID=A0AAV2Q3P8_MEGNR